jgi:hypothetical protein
MGYPVSPKAGDMAHPAGAHLRSSFSASQSGGKGSSPVPSRPNVAGSGVTEYWLFPRASGTAFGLWLSSSCGVTYRTPTI